MAGLLLLLRLLRLLRAVEILGGQRRRPKAAAVMTTRKAKALAAPTEGWPNGCSA
jgi:uncharacterized Ntn-hydrolase superfamily protein